MRLHEFVTQRGTLASQSQSGGRSTERTGHEQFVALFGPTSKDRPATGTLAKNRDGHRDVARARQVAPDDRRVREGRGFGDATVQRVEVGARRRGDRDHQSARARAHRGQIR